MSRTKKTVFVLISGKAGVGKTTLANYLSTSLPTNYDGISVVRTAFADPIKSTARSVFNWDGKKGAKGRRLLQVIGTEAGRKYNENLWVEKTVNNVLQMNIYPPNFVIIDDWRYPNECYYIQNQNVHDVYTIKIEAENRESLKGTPEANHISEKALEDYIGVYNYTVDNTKGYNNLYRQGDEVIDALKKQFILE